MNYRMILRTVGFVLSILAALMLLPLIAGVCYGEGVAHFAVSIIITGAIGLTLSRLKPRTQDFYARDGFVTVGLVWISMSLLGALPFVLSGDIPNYLDAVFETVSGFTTTGATILPQVEVLSRGCMFWRMFTQWIGGMGVLVFMMAVMPMCGDHSMHIMRAEFPGPTVGKLVPRARQTALLLYLIYIFLTAADTVLLMLGGMSFYDALLHSFAIAGTGGFSTYTLSVGSFSSLYIELVISISLIIFSINFNLHYMLLIGRVKTVLRSEELRFFLGSIIAATLLVALNLRADLGAQGALRHAFFAVSNMVSTASFSTLDYTQWPQFTQWVLLMLMFVGACAGSTGGGLKVSRFIMLVKSAASDVRRMIHPRRVTRIQLDGSRVESGTLKAVYTYFLIYVLIIVAGTMVVSLDDYDMTTNFTAALACISNIGPGMGQIGPASCFNIFSVPVKMVLAVIMLLGRLELYPILAFFAQTTWRE